MAVWGTENITLCQKHVGEPLLFLNVAAKHAGELELNLWTDRLIVADCQCEKMDSLKTKAAEAGFADDRELLTSKHVSTWDPDRADQDVLNQEALLSCCALLQLASDDMLVSLPQLLQLNGMRLEAYSLLCAVLPMRWPSLELLQCINRLSFSILSNTKLTHSDAAAR